MKVTGIIAEYNPFHRGHQYQINYIKEKLNTDYVIVALSGDYVQRGTPALFPKHLRAEMALRCGADLVLEMPVSVSTASAEAFAMGGVSVLDRNSGKRAGRIPDTSENVSQSGNVFSCCQKPGTD